MLKTLWLRYNRCWTADFRLAENKDPPVLAELLLYYLVHLVPTGGNLRHVFMSQAHF